MGVSHVVRSVVYDNGVKMDKKDSRGEAEVVCRVAGRVN